MNIKLKALGVVLSMLGVGHVQAFDLWQTYTAARTIDPTYLTALAQTEVAAAQKNQARAAMLPTLGLSASAYHTRDNFLTTDRKVKTNPTTVRVVFNQPLLDIGSLTAFKQVGLNSSTSDLKLQQAEQDLIVRVVQTYFTALLAQGNASVAERQRSAAAQQVEMARRNFEVGNSTVIDKNEAEAAYYNARASEITALSNKDNALAALEDMVGHAINEPLSSIEAPLRLKMPVPDTQAQWVERARKANYAVRIAQLSDDMATLEIRRRGEQRLPKLDLVASSQWKNTNINHDNNVNSQTNSVGLELSMPLFDGGLIGAQVEEARALQQQSMQSVRGTERATVQATRAAYSQATSGLASIEALESARKAASASVKANSLGYKFDMRINIDVLNAQNIDAQTQYNLAQAQYNTIIGNVNLKAAIAQLGENDVRYINALLTEPKKHNLKTSDPLPASKSPKVPK